jgi:hypothetical protein
MSADSVATWNWMSGAVGLVRQRAHEAAALVDADGQRPAAVQQPLQAELRLADPANCAAGRWW